MVPLLPHPGRVLVNAGESGNEFWPRHDQASSAGKPLAPVIGNVDASRYPDVIVARDVVDESRQCRRAPGTPGQSTMQSDGHHFRPLSIQNIERGL